MNRPSHKSRYLSTSCSNLATNRSGHSGSSRSIISENVIRFQDGIRQRLSASNQELVTDILSLYHRNRNVPHLVASLTKVLKTKECQSIFFLLREVLPHCDRPEYDHFVSMHFYKLQRDPSLNSRGHTIDSGFGSNSVATHSTAPRQPKYRSSGRKVNGFDNSASSSGHSSTFGSAVRRKVIAALQRTGSKRKKIPTDRTRRHSFAGHAETSPKVTSTKRQHSSAQKLTIPPDAQDVVIDRLKSRSGDMGFSIRGGTDHSMGIFVSQLDPNSIAEKAGLMLGDRLLLVNGCEMHNVRHEDAVKMSRIV